MTRKTVAVVVGRWQLVHQGQEALFQAAFGLADEVIAVLGSSYKARDPRNPFVHEERRQMLLANLSEAQRQRLHVLPVRDYFDDRRWNAAVTLGVRALAGEEADIVLVGHRKDHTSYYLNNFPRWRQQLVDRLADVDATAMRQVFFEAGPCQGVARLAAYLDRQVEAGRLAIPDTEVAAQQFLDLCSAWTMKRLLFAAGTPPTSSEIERRVEGGLAMFFAAYAPR